MSVIPFAIGLVLSVVIAWVYLAKKDVHFNVKALGVFLVVAVLLISGYFSFIMKSSEDTAFAQSSGGYIPWMAVIILGLSLSYFGFVLLRKHYTKLAKERRIYRYVSHSYLETFLVITIGLLMMFLGLGLVINSFV